MYSKYCGTNEPACGRVIWITGLSDSGKTTLALLLAQLLRKQCASLTLLDGDQLREVFGGALGYDRMSRLQLAYRYSALCRMLSMQGHTVIIATIALFREIHVWNREQLPGYFEVFLNTPLDELRRRDSKGLYRRYDEGKLTHVYGLDLQADYPLHPDYEVVFDPRRLPEAIAEELAEVIMKRYGVPPVTE